MSQSCRTVPAERGQVCNKNELKSIEPAKYYTFEFVFSSRLRCIRQQTRAAELKGRRPATWT